MVNLKSIVKKVSDSLTEKLLHSSKLKININSSKKNPENLCGYKIVMKNEGIELDLFDQASLPFALKQLEQDLKIGREQIFNEVKKPEFKLRPLMIAQHKMVKISNNFVIHYIGKDHIHEICKEAKKLGFNAIVLGSFLKTAQYVCQELDEFKECCHIIREHHLKIIVMPHFVGQDTYPLTFSLDEIKEVIEIADFLMWSSLIFLEGFEENLHAEEMTYQETLALEIKLIEAKVSKPIIYYIPEVEGMHHKQVNWLRRLHLLVRESTLLAFSAFTGGIEETYQPLHPLFWDLYKTQEALSLKYLPIGALSFNSLNAFFHYAVLEQLSSYLNSEHFIGFVTVVYKMPKSSDILYSGVYAWLQRLWFKKNISHALEEWIIAENNLSSVSDLIMNLVYLQPIITELQILSRQIGSKDRLPYDNIKSSMDYVIASLNYFYLKKKLPTMFVEEIKPLVESISTSLCITHAPLFQENSMNISNFVKVNRLG